MTAACFHVIELNGKLIFESMHSNFRMAISEYLNGEKNEGIQLNIKDLCGNNEEDIVVNMTLVRMKQNPQDNIVKPGAPVRVKAPVKAEATASDTCFY
jgi:shikimate 5-dehydrogenase